MFRKNHKRGVQTWRALMHCVRDMCLYMNVHPAHGCARRCTYADGHQNGMTAAYPRCLGLYDHCSASQHGRVHRVKWNAYPFWLICVCFCARQQLANLLPLACKASFASLSVAQRIDAVSAAHPAWSGHQRQWTRGWAPSGHRAP